ncbi:MAG: Wadjet anti-phage system protein JetD domain-containing protein [Tractidigestivibacter sp.]|jgi:hypothetical protein|uniref:Wadjet anti-phage system protein JetD domain-containing protein n=1 Tax=Tractidigestivibacter sp. TaxID=2847320 RepID=UPI003D8DAB2A
MARKLTIAEHRELEFLDKKLREVSEPLLRGKTAAIASALVRSKGELVSDEQLDEIFSRYDEDADTLKGAVLQAVLVEDDPTMGTYSLLQPDDAYDEDSDATVSGGSDAAEEDASTPQDGEDPTNGGEATDDADPLPDDAAASEPGENDQDGAKGDDDANASDGAGQSESVATAAPAEPAKNAGNHDSGNHGGPKRLADVPYVRRGGPAVNEVREKILALDQRFWMNGWLLSHPGAYTLYERELTGINEALSDGTFSGDITRRQLAYQLGGDEKFFEYGSDGYKLLRALGMEDVIRHRPMPRADLVFHAPRLRHHMRVLVTENLDPYLDVHDIMYEEGRTTILGERIHAVVLGAGIVVVERNRLALLLDTLGADSVEVLYWGDIDRAGFDVMLRLKSVLGDRYPFKPFVPAYRLMIEKAMERYPDPADNEETGQTNVDVPDLSILCDELREEEAAYVRAVIDGCRLVPQEIVTRRDL